MPIRIDSSDIELTINGKEIKYVESYEIKYGIFAQPGSFSITCGWSDTAGKLIKEIQPYMPFKLKIGGKPAFSGRIDSIVVREGEGTQVVITGRDNVGELFRYKVDRDVHFTRTTYVGLLRDVLARINVSPVIVLGTAEAEANKRLGTAVRRYGFVINPETDQIDIKESISSINSGVTAKLGESFYTFLKAYFDRGSLFLWSGTNNEFILSRPNVQQDPIYQLIRGRSNNSLQNRANCKLVEYKNDITERHAEIRVNCRVGTTISGRTQFLGSATDPEILNYGLKNFRSVRDKKTNNLKQAEDMAKRIRAEEQRKGSRLIYVVAGHRTKSLKGTEVVYTPDTMITVLDEELGIEKVMYLEDVKYSRNLGSGTTTQLTLVNPDFMVFLPRIVVNSRHEVL